MLHFDNPTGFALLALALPITALYLLRHKRPPLKVPSLQLYRLALRSQRAESRLQRPRFPLELLLQLLGVLLAALLAAKPTFGEVEASHPLVIVLDCTASMATQDEGGEARIEAAKREALRLLAGRGRARSFAVFASSEPRASASRDAEALRAEIERAQAHDTGGSLEAAVTLAEERLRGEPDAQIYVLTDHGAGYQTQKPAVRIMRFGGPAENVALLGGRALPRPEHGDIELVATAMLYGDAPREVRVQLRALADAHGAKLGDEVLDTRLLTLQPGRASAVRFSVSRASAAGAYSVALEGRPDPLDRDDRLVITVTKDPRLPVAVIGARAKSSPVSRALAADPSVSLQMLSFDEHAQAEIDEDALEIFLGVCPNQPGAPKRRGRDLVIFAPPPGRCFDVDVGEPTAEVRTLAGFRSHDPRVRFLSLDDVHATSATTLRPRGGVGVLAEDRNAAPLIVDGPSQARMITMVGFSLDHSDFAERRSFVVFVRNLTELSSRYRSLGTRGSLRTGSAASVAIPDDTVDLTLYSPGGDRRLRAQGGEVVVPPQERAGLLTLRWEQPSPGALLLASSFADATESDLRASTGAESAPAQPTETPRASRLGGLLSVLTPMPMLAGLLVTLLAFEVLVFMRRPRWLGGRAKSGGSP